MTDEQNGPPEGLLNMAEHYAGKRDLQALLNTQEWKTTFTRFEEKLGPEDAFDATVQALSKVTSSNAAVPALFLRNITGFNYKKGEKYRASLVLTEHGARRVGDGSFNGGPLQEVNLQGLTVEHDLWAKTTKFEGGKDAVITPGQHGMPMPNIRGFGALAKVCREQSKKSPLIVGELREEMAMAIVVNEPGRLIYINADTDSFRCGAEFYGKSDDGGYARCHITPAQFEEAFGFDIFDDLDSTKAALEGQRFIGNGPFSVLSKISDEIEEYAAAKLEEILRNNTGPRGSGKDPNKLELKKPAEVTGPNGDIIPIVGGYEGRDGFVFQTDCQVLGYAPEFTVSHDPNGPMAWKTENAFIVFPDVEHGKPPVQARFRGASQYFKTV